MTINDACSERHQILGFQLRIPIAQVGNWDPTRRSTYLLCEDIVYPLSVDEAVWPSLEDALLTSENFSDPYDSPNGLRLHSIKSMSSISVKKDAALIAIAAAEADANRLRARHRIESPLISVEELQSHRFNLLGYDVADAWFVSGLTNCGYAFDAKKGLSARYGKALNEYGLFSGIAEAQLFRAECDGRISKHAPFYVFGLWAYGGK